MFYVGQKVVFVGFPSEGLKDCIIRVWNRFLHPYNDPTLGEVYTVAKVRQNSDDLIIELIEHESGDLNFWEPGFYASGFRPVVERKTDISIFTNMLKDEKINA